jgi:hypothetical protein
MSGWFHNSLRPDFRQRSRLEGSLGQSVEIRVAHTKHGQGRRNAKPDVELVDKSREAIESSFDTKIGGRPSNDVFNSRKVVRLPLGGPRGMLVH